MTLSFRFALVPSAIALVALSAGAQTTPAPVTPAPAVQPPKRPVRVLDTLTLDAVGNELRTHAKLGRTAYGQDDYKGIFEHTRKVIELAPKLSPETQKRVAPFIINAYADLAYAYGNKMHPDSALQLVKRAPSDLPAIKDTLTAALASSVARYALVGTKATALGADHWINTAGSYPVAGKVSVLEFTAHWCGPCRASYPMMAKWNSALGPKGLDVVFAAQIEGEFGSKEVQPTEEVSLNREYFVDKHSVTWPVAFQPASPGNEPAKPGTNWARYEVGGIPEIVIIDRDGIIRQIVVGYDVESEATITPVLESLLAKGSARASR